MSHILQGQKEQMYTKHGVWYRLGVVDVQAQHLFPVAQGTL